MLDGGGGYLSGNQAFASQVGDTSKYWNPRGMGIGAGGAGAGIGGSWVMPALGMVMQLLGAFGGKKTGAMKGFNATMGLADIAQALQNPFDSNKTGDILGGDKDKKKNNNQAMSIGGLTSMLGGGSLSPFETDPFT